jgi:hypothetical protein
VSGRTARTATPASNRGPTMIAGHDANTTDAPDDTTETDDTGSGHGLQDKEYAEECPRCGALPHSPRLVDRIYPSLSGEARTAAREAAELGGADAGVYVCVACATVVHYDPTGATTGGEAT